jgi:hydroxymethylpyrimidine/phosphomethylpyrimidine kinase
MTPLQSFARNSGTTPICVLTIAGSDSSAGAGIQADARTIQALGGYALTAVTAVTAQNARGVVVWRKVPAGLIAAQIEAVLKDFPVAAIKTGLLPGADAVRAVAKALKRHARIPLVVDPIVSSTSGTRFLSSVGVKALKKELFPRAMLVTPNWLEAAELSGKKVLTDVEAAAAARFLAKEYGCAVLVKGGHAPGDRCHDCLATADGRVRWFSGSRIITKNTHGTGCVLSSAITLRLARGDTIEDAVASARRFLSRSLAAGRRIRWGRGNGPAFAGNFRTTRSRSRPQT